MRWTHILGRINVSARNPFGNDAENIFSMALKNCGFKDHETLAISNFIYDVFRSIECKSFKTMNFWNLMNKGGDPINEIPIPVVPLMPMGEKDYFYVTSSEVYRKHGMFDILLGGDLRGFDKEEEPYLIFWLETLASIMECCIVLTYENGTGGRKNVYINTELCGEHREKRVEWLTRYFKLYIDWKKYKEKDDNDRLEIIESLDMTDEEKCNKLKDWKSSHLSFQKYVLKNL